MFGRNLKIREMKIKDVDKDEIIKLSACLLSIVGPDEFEKSFPSFNNWCMANVTEIERNKLVKEMIQETNQSKAVTLEKDDFISLYAYTQAVLGFEETMQRFPKVRLLVLNLMNEKELDQVMNLIKSIEERIHLNH